MQFSPLSLGKLCEDHGYSYEWASGQKPHLKKMAENPIQHGKLCIDRCSRIIDRFYRSIESTSPTSLPHDTTEDSSSSPVTIRRRNASSPPLGNEVRDSTETKKQ